MSRSVNSEGPSVEGSPEPKDSPSRSVFEGLAKHSLIYGLGMVLQRAVSFIMLPIYTRYLTPADYGVLALVEMTLDFISIVGGAQLALGVFRFYHKTDDPLQRQEVVSTSFFMVGALYGIIGFATFLGAPLVSSLVFGSDIHADVIRIGAANLAVGALLIVPLAFARVENLSVLYVSVSSCKLVLALVFNILFVVVMDMGVMGVFLSSLITNVLVGGVVSLWLVRRVGASFSSGWSRNLLRFGAPLMATKLASFIATFSDRYFLQAAADETAVGLYSLAYQFGFLLLMVGFTPFDMVWGPKRFEVARSPDRDRLLSQGFVLLNLLLITTGLGIALFVPDVLKILSAPAFHGAAAVVPLILVAYILQAWSSTQDIGILVSERTSLITFANFASAGVAVVGYALLVPAFLEWGAATATLVAFLTRYALTYSFSQRLWRVAYEWRPVALLATWAAVIFAIHFFLPHPGILLSLGLRTALVGLYFAGLWILPIFPSHDRAAAARFAGDHLQRLRSRS